MLNLRISWLLALSASGVAVSLAAGETVQGKYLRPLNDDCIAQGLGLSSLGSTTTGQYFPSEFVTDTTPQRFQTGTEDAEKFTVAYYDTYKVVVNEVANITYVLYECGSDVPDAGSVPEGAAFFQVPLTSLSVSETVPFAFLEALGVADRVHDVSPYVTSACGQKLVACGRLSPTYMGYDGVLDEAAVKEGTKVADAIIVGSAGKDAPPPLLAFDAENDPGLLRRAEWIKYLGLFFNREKKAAEVYAAIVARYEAVKKQSMAEVEAGAEPVIAWVSHYNYDGEEHFDVSFAGYKEELVGDVGGAMPAGSAQALVDAIPGTRLGQFSEDTVEFAWEAVGDEGTFASREAAEAAFLEFLSGVDAVVDESYALDPATYDFATEYGFAAPAELLVYRLDGKLSEENGYDWFESSFVRPDLALRDVQRIADSARQGENVDGFEFTWLRNIDEDPVVVVASECERIKSCDQKPDPICPFVQVCGDGKTALLLEDSYESYTDGASCRYESCDEIAGSASNDPNDANDANDENEENAAQMAAPAVVLITLLVVFVEALLQFC